MERFVIREGERRHRWIGVGWGLVFSAGLIAVVAFDYQRDPQLSVRGLLWSVIIVLTMTPPRERRSIDDVIHQPTMAALFGKSPFKPHATTHAHRRSSSAWHRSAGGCSTP
jgi:hypothetical protein